MIVLIVVRQVPVPAGAEPKVERNVIGPYDNEATMQRDMDVAEQAGFQTAAYECEDPEVFRSTLGLPL